VINGVIFHSQLKLVLQKYKYLDEHQDAEIEQDSSMSVRNLVIVLYNSLDMEKQMNSICKSCYYVKNKPSLFVSA